MPEHRGNSVGPTNHGARPINSWRRARVGGQRDPNVVRVQIFVVLPPLFETYC